MSRHCPVSGARARVGNHVSHSHRRTRRRWQPNLQRKRFWVPTLGRHVTLRLSAHGLRMVDARGIDAVVAELLAAGARL